MFVQQFYHSTATHPRGHASDLEILRSAVLNNEARGLTGFLFRTPKRFFQLIEGSDEQVSRTMTAIRQDTRHFDIQEWPLLINQPRAFPEWTMGYGDSLPSDLETALRDVPGNIADLVELVSELVISAQPFLTDRAVPQA